MSHMMFHHKQDPKQILIQKPYLNQHTHIHTHTLLTLSFSSIFPFYFSAFTYHCLIYYMWIYLLITHSLHSDVNVSPTKSTGVPPVPRAVADTQ